MAKKSSETPQTGGAAKRGKVGASKQGNAPAAESTTANSAAAATTGKTGGAGAAKAAGGAKGASKGAGAAKSGAAKSGGAKAADGAAKTGSRGGGAKSGSRTQPKTDLRRDLRDFASGRPDGWNHEDWMGFLEHLQSRGHNINDRDQIGTMLERERLAVVLEKVQGMGPARVNAIAERYGSIWNLRNTSAEDLSRDASIPQPLAEKVVEAVRG